jgi:hypothetical protein
MTNMTLRPAATVAAVMFLALAAGGCEYARSSNPLQPVIAEPSTGTDSAPPAPAPRNPCAFGDGAALVQCVAARYPEYTTGGISGHHREANMAFLRDRIIEAGTCGGLDLAWNLKRGVGPHSIDALAWRTPSGHVEVVDIGIGYDDASQPLQLQWAIVGGPPGYDTYQPRPACG